MRVRIVKDYKKFKKGDVVDVSPNVGFDLTDKGIGILSKDITQTDTEVKRGRPARLRSNLSR